jgi:signal transduction histidine kinase
VRVNRIMQRLRLSRRGERKDVAMLTREIAALRAQLEAAQRSAQLHTAELEQIRHTDRLATLGRLASSMAHELGNPLNVIELRAQLVSSGDVSTLQQAQQNTAVIVEQTRRMTRIIGEILSFGRMQPPEITRLDLVSVLRKAVALLDHTSKLHNVHLELTVHKPVIELEGDADKVLQMVVNLVVNGLQAMPEGGELTISTCEVLRASAEARERTARAYVQIDVADSGVGIQAPLVAKVFEPFFSTKLSHGGTGLGLSVALSIAREHEGWIAVTSEPGHGSTFKVYLAQRRVRSELRHAG